MSDTSVSPTSTTSLRILYTSSRELLCSCFTTLPGWHEKALKRCSLLMAGTIFKHGSQHIASTVHHQLSLGWLLHHLQQSQYVCLIVGCSTRTHVRPPTHLHPLTHTLNHTLLVKIFDTLILRVCLLTHIIEHRLGLPVQIHWAHRPQNATSPNHQPGLNFVCSTTRKES